MSWEMIASIFGQIGAIIFTVLPYVIAAGLIFPMLTVRFACNPGGPWWKRRDLATDLCYWFIVPIFTVYLRFALLVTGMVLLFGIDDSESINNFFTAGRGPLAAWPFWAQLLFYLIVSDFLLYWIHRIFHGASMWKYHAVHHSSETVDWISAARFHPVNLALGTILVDIGMLLVGVPPTVLGVLAPFVGFMSAFVHANLNWTLGPFKYVLVSPVFHRWHHTAPDRGGSKNFAVNFPVLDLVFGTFHMPEGELPSDYGIDDPAFPRGFGAQLVYPFKQ